MIIQFWVSMYVGGIDKDDLLLSPFTGEDDFRDICIELVTIRASYYQLGVFLGLPPSELDTIRKEHSQIDLAFNEVILRWLRQRYKVERFGHPTWKRLVEAVDNPIGANNPALALEIAAKHPGMYYIHVHDICVGGAGL